MQGFCTPRRDCGRRDSDYAQAANLGFCLSCGDIDGEVNVHALWIKGARLLCVAIRTVEGKPSGVNLDAFITHPSLKFSALCPNLRRAEMSMDRKPTGSRVKAE